MSPVGAEGEGEGLWLQTRSPAPLGERKLVPQMGELAQD